MQIYHNAIHYCSESKFKFRAHHHLCHSRKISLHVFSTLVWLMHVASGHFSALMQLHTYDSLKARLPKFKFQSYHCLAHLRTYYFTLSTSRTTHAALISNFATTCNPTHYCNSSKFTFRAYHRLRRSREFIPTRFQHSRTTRASDISISTVTETWWSTVTVVHSHSNFKLEVISAAAVYLLLHVFSM